MSSIVRAIPEAHQAPSIMTYDKATSDVRATVNEGISLSLAPCGERSRRSIRKCKNADLSREATAVTTFRTHVLSVDYNGRSFVLLRAARGFARDRLFVVRGSSLKIKSRSFNPLHTIDGRDKSLPGLMRTRAGGSAIRNR